MSIYQFVWIVFLIEKHAFVTTFDVSNAMFFTLR